jgi:hypothetical protein
MAKPKEREKKKKKGAKKAIGLAAAAAAAAIAPEAAEAVVQKTEAPQPVTQAPSLEAPEPPRFEYTKPRPLRTITDLIKGAIRPAAAQAATGTTAPLPALPPQPSVPSDGATVGNPATPLPIPQHPEAVVGTVRTALRNLLALNEEQARSIHVVRVENTGQSSPSRSNMSGFRFTFQHGSEFFVYQTNADGTSVQLTSRTNEDPGPMQ